MEEDKIMDLIREIKPACADILSALRKIDGRDLILTIGSGEVSIAVRKAIYTDTIFPYDFILKS